MKKYKNYEEGNEKERETENRKGSQEGRWKIGRKI